MTGTVGNDATGATEILEGTVSGDEISFVQMITRGDFRIRIQYSGKVKGDELELTRAFRRGPGGGQPGGRRGPGGPVTFAARRVR